MFTTGEIAKYCGVNFRTVIRWIKRGHLKAYQLPGRGDNRIEMADFLDFLQAHHFPLPPELQTQTHRLLICIPESFCSEYFLDMVALLGFETRMSPNPFLVSAQIEVFMPTLVAIDAAMFEDRGRSIIHFIKQTPRHAHISILMICATDERAYIDLQADQILEKPLVMSKLVAIIKKIRKAA